MTADPFPASDVLACPACGATAFVLTLGGRESGAIKCQECRTVIDSPDAPRGRGRPAIGPLLSVRVPDALRARIETARDPGEALADTVRRLLDESAPPDVRIGYPPPGESPRVWVVECVAPCGVVVSRHRSESAALIGRNGHIDRAHARWSGVAR